MAINVAQLRQYIVKPAITSIGLWSQAAENLLMGTCAQESELGTYLKQVNGPALGIFQIEPATHTDIWINYLRAHDDLRARVVEINHYDETALIFNLKYAAAIARLIYYRVDKLLPDANDLPGLARYYKLYYNTLQGKATEQQFMDNYRRFVL